jgi:hypothetical protein
MKSYSTNFIYPKLLILNTSFNPSEGAGITIRNLVCNFPKDRIGNACLKCFLDENICNTYFNLDASMPVSKLTLTNGKVNFLDVSEVKDNFVKKLFIGFKTLLEGIGLINKIKVTDKFIDWVEKNDFDVIYAVSYTSRDLPFLISCLKQFKVPFVVHIYDDWIKHNRYGYFGLVFSGIIEQRFKYLLKNSDGHLCISKKMEREYKERYNLDFEVFHNPFLNNSLIPYKQKKVTESNIKISVFGTIGDNNIDEIIMLNRVVDGRQDEKIKIHLYGSVRRKSIYEKLLRLNRVVMHGFLTHNQVLDQMTQSDLLFLPLSFNHKFESYFKLSMPTKITEYLGSNVPILLFSPKSFAASEYLELNKCAFIVNDFCDVALSECLGKALFDLDERNTIIENARNLIVNRHLLNDVGLRLRNYLIHTIQTKNG